MTSRRQRAPRQPVSVEALKHQDKRVNIPTAELSDFVTVDESAPPKMSYPRDPSLDPQLVWKGKDEQDQADLEVPLVPIYIQEKIHPRAIIEEVQAQANKERPEQFNLFSDFNGIEWEQLVEFYQHEQNWTNRMVLGDSLMVMASLAEKEALKGKVQTIYIDPPYGIRFGSNWQVSTRKRDVRDGRAEDVAREPEVVKAFRDTWELGVHSYLTYLRDRFVAARELLTETGSIFVQIGDENVHLVRSVLDEVFGSENFCSLVTFNKTTGFTSQLLANVADYLLWYGKNRRETKFRQLYREKEAGDEGAAAYRAAGETSGLRESEIEPTRPVTLDQLTSQGASARAADSQVFCFNGKDYRPGAGLHWKTTVQGLERLALARRIAVGGTHLRYVRFMDDFPIYPISNLWRDTGTGQFTEPKQYVVQTNTKVIERCVLMTTDPGDLVLDPTCGSGTTAYVAEQWGRRWITIDTSRVALALARTRLMAARFPYYQLTDTPEGARREAEILGQTAPTVLPAAGDIRKGFVYKRVPHVQLNSIANNPDIREGLSREEIDAAIARHAETELLYDQPYEDNRRVRVAGPFTVESLSPHRILRDDADRPATEREAREQTASTDFATMIIENLRKAGVQNTRRDERLRFDSLEPFANPWIHAEGRYTDKDGLSRRVGISIGPEYGAVGTEQVKEAAKEALKGIGFDLLVVCGLAFDAHAGETAKEFQPEVQDKSSDFAMAEEQRQYGKLPVLLARINPDLTMGMAGEELLKKTGAGNLFMVFGEPDIEIEAQDDGKLVVEIKGLDVYDPTTGQIRSNTTDDIACWFIDTAYNEESFFVRHAYFTGADEPYDRLKRALRAEIDEAAWSQLYSTRSFPFGRPASGKIAVKVINPTAMRY